MAEELNQAVEYAEWHQVPHWSLDQHEHRQALTKILHAATGQVPAKKIKPMKPYVTDEMLEASAHRTRLITTISREEKYAKHLDQRRVLKAWKEISHWIAGHRKPTHVPWKNSRISHRVIAEHQVK